MDRITPADIVALLAIVVSVSIAVFYPETFIVDPPVVAYVAFVPLNLLLPFFTVVAAVYVFLRRRLLKPAAVDLALLSFMAYMLVRNIMGPEAAGVVKYIIYGTGLFYMAALITVKPRMLEVLIWSLVAIAAVTVLYGFAEYAAQTNLFYQDAVSKVIPEPPQGVHRVGSTLAHPVAYGGYLIMILPFMLLIWFRSERRLYRAVGVLFSLATVVALILTFSKGSWLVAGILGAAAILMFLFKKRGASARPLLYILLVLVLAGVFFGQQVVSETFWRADYSVGHRLFAWEAALEGIAENPVMGVGYRQGSIYLFETPDGQEYYFWAKKPMAVDNNYLNLLLEGGVIALALWLFFLAFILYEGVRGFLGNKEKSSWLLAAVVCIVGLTINALTFEAWQVWPTFILFMVVAGMIRGWSLRQAAVMNMPATRSSDRID